MDVKNLRDLQTREYWDARYESEGATHVYDWFRDFDSLYSTLRPLLPKPEDSPRILELGCGNSTLTPGLHAKGFSGIVGLDFAPTLISQLRARHKGVQFLCLDILELERLADDPSSGLGGAGSWDVVLDKGTLDALVAEKGDVWNPSDEVKENAKREIDGALRLLKPGGKFIYLTWMSSPLRMPFLQRPGQWDVQVSLVETTTAAGGGGGGFDYYMYVATKKDGEEEQQTAQ